MMLFVDTLLKNDADAPEMNPVLYWESGQINRSAFETRVRQVSDWLLESGVTRGDRVAIAAPKGPCAIISWFAALSVGAIAVPLDFQLPVIRLNAVIADLEPAVLITTAAIAEIIDSQPESMLIERIQVNDIDSLPQPGNASGASRPKLDATDPAMILMTSGSTGVPKGVVLSHGNISAFINWAVETFDLREDDCFLNLAPLHFDLSILDVLASYRVGASVYLLPEKKAAFPHEIVSVLLSFGVTILYTVPTLLRMLTVRSAFTSAQSMNLRWLLSAGEVLPADLARHLQSALPGTSIANLYGPTETNVITCKLIGKIADNWNEIPVGLPCQHATITIRDENGEVLPDGTVGEICVTGPTVTSSGYWRQPELTASVRIDGDPASYRTGDLGRRDSDGSIRFLGRRDMQVKIRGHRVELTEIELVAQGTGLVKGAAAVTINGSHGSKRLILAVVPLRQGADLERQIHAALSQRLARSACPERIAVMDALPLTHTGKLDRLELARQVLRVRSHTSLAQTNE